MQIIAPMKQRRKCGAMQWVLKVSGFTLLCFSCNPTLRFIWMTNVSLFSFLYLKWQKTRGKWILSLIISSKRNIVSFGKTISNFKSYYSLLLKIRMQTLYYKIYYFNPKYLYYFVVLLLYLKCYYCLATNFPREGILVYAIICMCSIHRFFFTVNYSP